MEILSSLSQRRQQRMRSLPLNYSDLSQLYRAEQLLTGLGEVLQRLELKHLSQLDTLRTLMHKSAVRLENSDDITSTGADGRFVCNDGSLSQSKRFCSGYGSSEACNPVRPSASTRKAKSKKVTTAKKQEPQSVAENDEPVSTQLRQPTCTPLYMAN